MTAVAATAHLLSPTAGSVAAAASSPASDDGFSFSDLLDIVNPLQHIPIVATLYRALTGDQIKTFPKIAGDALFGGVTGFFGSVADTIFEKITGKSVGDTVLAWIEREVSGPPTALASATPAPSMAVTVAPASLDTLVIPGQNELLLALTRKNVDQDLALRAANAYRSVLSVSGSAVAAALR
jgi:hypothetical protein